MKEYEMIREIENECERNQFRDVFIEEIETDDPLEYLKNLIAEKDAKFTVDDLSDGRINIYVESNGMTQKFLFTEI